MYYKKKYLYFVIFGIKYVYFYFSFSWYVYSFNFCIRQQLVLTAIAIKKKKSKLIKISIPCTHNTLRTLSHAIAKTEMKEISIFFSHSQNMSKFW